MAADKNEILFSRFGINYNNEPLIYRKGSVIYRSYEQQAVANGEASETKAADLTSKTQIEKERKRKLKAVIAVEHVDLIGEAFWDAHPYILATKRK